MINLNSKINEYINLGIRLGYFTSENIPRIQNILGGINIVIDNSLPGYAMSSQDGHTLYINYDGINGEYGYYFLDEVLFHEFTHFINDIHRDLFGENGSRILEFSSEYSYVSNLNTLTNHPAWGGILLDEVIAQTIAQKFVEEKYQQKIYKQEDHSISFSEPPFYYKSNLTEYGEYEQLALYFANYLFGKPNSLDDLCKLSFNDNCVDYIFSTIAHRNEPINLYKILGYMGNICLTDYVLKGRMNEQSGFIKETIKNRDPRNIFYSIDLVKKLTNN